MIFNLRRLKLKIISLNLFAIFLGGCWNHCIVDEKVNYPKSTRIGIQYTNDKTDLSRMAWWKKLNDPELDQLITQALCVNYSIKGAYATIEQAQARLKAAQYAWIPTLDASASNFTGAFWHLHVTKRSLLPVSPIPSTISKLKFRGGNNGFHPSYSLNILKNINNIDAAKATLAMKEAQAQAIKLEIISQITSIYFRLLSQREQLSVEKKLRSDLRKLRQLEEIRFHKGANDIETIMSIDQQLAQEEAKIPQIESAIAQDENTIHFLLNQNPGPVITHQTLLSMKTDHLIPTYLPSSVLKNRPDIIIALNQVKIAYAQIGVAYSVFFPTISLTGFAGESSIDLHNLLRITTNIWYAQFAILARILDAASYQNIRAAKVEYKAIYYDYLEVLLSAFAEVDNVLTNERKEKLSYLKTQKGYFAAKNSYGIARAQFKAGLKDYRTVVNAKITLDQTKLSLIQEKARLLDSVVNVYNAVGGGYEYIDPINVGPCDDLCCS